MTSPPSSASTASRAFPRASYGNGRDNGGIGGPATSSGILVRAHAGFGEVADFDPVTGALRGVALGVGPVGGVYGDLGPTHMVFYRDGARLVLRAGERVIDLDGQVAAQWQQVDNRTTRLVLTVADRVVCDVHYPAVPPDFDLGLLIRDVLADPVRRTRIFAG